MDNRKSLCKRWIASISFENFSFDEVKVTPNFISMGRYLYLVEAPSNTSLAIRRYISPRHIFVELDCLSYG